MNVTPATLDVTGMQEMLNELFTTKRFCQAQTLLIVPPFLRLNSGSLGVHLLQACAQEQGHKVVVLYANLFFAQFIGESNYNGITFSHERSILGDRVFAHAAYGIGHLGFNGQSQLANYVEKVRIQDEKTLVLDHQLLHQASQAAVIFTELLAEVIAAHNFSCVGCTSMFSQTAASVAFLNEIKRQDANITTLIGGANCAGEMAQGIVSLSDQIDYVFNGESETVFVDLLAQLKSGHKPNDKIIVGERCDDLDSLPDVDYYDYYQQIGVSEVGVDMSLLHMPYESSRGCWWGQKHHCTFCGVYEMRYRQKSSSKVLQQLKRLLAEHPSNYVLFVDDIMPRSFFKELLPRIPRHLPEIQFFIDQKADLSLQKMRALKDAGAYDILPGIETLSTPLLKLLDKGVTARQNIQLLRYAKSCHMYVTWYFLYGIVGETVEHYQQMAKLLPLLTHLHPPVFFQEMMLMRFGLYVAQQDNFAVNNVQPLSVYQDILPKHADIERLAYYYSAEYPTIRSEAPEVFAQVDELVGQWRQLWLTSSTKPPQLNISQVGSQYVLLDTRIINTGARIKFLGANQAAAALVGHPLHLCPEDWPIDWAVKNHLAIVQDGWVIPLATADAELLQQFESLGHQLRLERSIDVQAVS